MHCGLGTELRPLFLQLGIKVGGSSSPSVASSRTFESVMSEIFNHRLVRLATACPSTEAGTGVIELPGQGLNLRWQSRTSAPTPYENALADAIEVAYLAGAKSPAEFAAALNDMTTVRANGDVWTAQSVEQELARLAQ